jgi:hypothetical protein
MPERFALYYAPATTHPLWLKAAQWLGRDPGGGPVIAADIAGIDTEYRWRISESARRYGFHATIKAPMALAPGEDQASLEAALVAFGRETPRAAIGGLKLQFIDGFLALVPVAPTAGFMQAAAHVVMAFDRFRAPLSAEDREQRLRGGKMSSRQVALLDRYGYPYVLEEFRFHMTLTDRLPESERAAVMAAALGWFGTLLGEGFVFDRIALFHEAEAGAPFMRLADYPFAAKVAVDA